MEKLSLEDSLFNDDWTAEVRITVGEYSSEVSEYFLSKVNDLYQM